MFYVNPGEILSVFFAVKYTHKKKRGLHGSSREIFNRLSQSFGGRNRV